MISIIDRKIQESLTSEDVVTVPLFMEVSNNNSFPALSFVVALRSLPRGCRASSSHEPTLDQGFVGYNGGLAVEDSGDIPLPDLDLEDMEGIVGA